MSEQTPPSGPLQPPPPSTARPAASPRSATPEELRRLISALGNPADDLYARAEDQLILLGAQAVPALIDALDERGPWLRAYRAAEALGQIGDGRASGPLTDALRHPNSNVRWSAARAIGKAGDWRVLQPFSPLRSVARSDRGKTSWGEPVAAAAQNTINEMSRRSTALRLTDPAKTAILCAVALLAILFASSQVQAFRETLSTNTAAVWGTAVTPIIPTPAPDEEDEEETPEAATTPTPKTTPTPASDPITATVIRDNANIRPAPNTNNTPLAQARAGETLEVLEKQGEWYRIRLADDPDQEAWIAVSVLGPPSAEVPER
ncbi:MAG TPA: SH3 domain-containing protein [Herpetosiphonaceae bacterium]